MYGELPLFVSLVPELQVNEWMNRLFFVFVCLQPEAWNPSSLMAVHLKGDN